MKKIFLFGLGIFIFLINILSVLDASGYWVSNSTMNASLPDVGSWEIPSVFYKDSSLYLISGTNDGTFPSFVWNGTQWLSNSTINASLPDLGNDAAPSVFYKDSSWYLIAGNSPGDMYGFVWNGTQWLSNSTINASLFNLGVEVHPYTFFKDSSWYILAGIPSGFKGFSYNGTDWLPNSTINASLPDFGSQQIASVFYKDSSWYLIIGNNDGGFNGYVWNETAWSTDLLINASLPDIGGEAAPSVFYKDSSWYLLSGGVDGNFYGFSYYEPLDCGTLNVANTAYTLNSNVSSNGTCFTISAANVTLDCNNSWITYSIDGLNGRYGVYSNQFNTTIKNCNVLDGNWISSNNSRHGIYITGDNSTLFNNSVNTSVSRSIYLIGVDNSNLTLNTGRSNNYPGIQLQSSSSNILVNNNGISGLAEGLFIYLSHNNTFINNSGISDVGDGVHVYFSNYNIFTNQTSIVYSTGSDGWGILMEKSNHTLFRDCGNTSGANYDIYYLYNTTNNITFINCSYNLSKEYLPGGNELTRKWYYQAYVNDSNGNAVENANISAFNNSNVLQFSVLTNSSGWIGRQEITEYVNTGGLRTYYENYTINVTKTYFVTETNTFNLATQQNRLDDSFTLRGLDCGDSLDVPGQTYTLTSNVSSNGTCFIVSAENITLDCNGYAINYSIGGGDYTYGIYSNQFNTTIKNCNVLDGNWTSGAGYGRYGVYFNGVDNGTIYNNYVRTNTSQAILLSNGANYNNLTNNIGKSGLHGINIFDGDNNLLINNLGNSTTASEWYGSGISITGENNTLINNTAGSIDYAFYLGGAGIITRNNILINNTAISNQGTAVLLNSADYNLFINQIARGEGAYAYTLDGSGNNLFRDCGEINSSWSDIDLGWDPGSVNNTFLNCSYEDEFVPGAGNYLIRKWYYQAYVNDSNGNAVENANISAFNNSNVLQFSVLTNSSGWIERQEVIDYINIQGDKTYYNNYTINATKKDYSNDNSILDFTIQQNKIDDSFTLRGLDCGDSLDVPGQTYTLTSNVSSNGTCFIVSAENITLDCKGHVINYSIRGGENTYGIYSNQFNTTIKNCNVIDGNWTSSQTTRYGVYFNKSDFGIILNNSISTNNSYGIYLCNESNFNNLTSNIVTSNTTFAFFLFNLSDNSLVLNTGISNKRHGISLNSVLNSNLISNTGMGRGCSNCNTDGIFLYLSDNNTLTNNTGISNQDGIILYSSSNNVLINNTGTSNITVGLYLYNSFNNTLINNTGLSNETDTSYGILLWISSNNILTSNTGISNSSHGIGIDQSTNNTLIKSTAFGFNSTGFRQSALYIRESNYTNISDCLNISGLITDVYVHSDAGSIENIFTNCSYNLSREFVNGTNNYLIKKWYYQGYVNDSKGYSLENVNITAKNISGIIQFNILTNSSGWIGRQEVIEYINLGNTRSYSNNYTFNATKTGYTSDNNTFNFTIQRNKIDDFFTLYDVVSPTYSSGDHNSEIAGRSITFSVNINDAVALHPNGQYIFSTNNSGIWVNNSLVNFTTTPSSIHVSKTLNSTVGKVVGYMWYFNDSAGNKNSTRIYTLTTEEEVVEEEDLLGGGGGGDEDSIFKPTYQQIAGGYEGYFRKGDIIQINLSAKGIYLVKIEDVNGVLNRTIFSFNQTNYSSRINGSVKINLNNDSFYDLEVTMFSVSLSNSSRISFREINEEIPALRNLGVNLTALGNNSNVTIFGGGKNTGEKKTFYFLVVGFIVFVMLIISLLLYLMLRKPKYDYKSKTPL